MGMLTGVGNDVGASVLIGTTLGVAVHRADIGAFVCLRGWPALALSSGFFLEPVVRVGAAVVWHQQYFPHQGPTVVQGGNFCWS